MTISRRFKCWLGFHHWTYTLNWDGRACLFCAKRQAALLFCHKGETRHGGFR